MKVVLFCGGLGMRLREYSVRVGKFALCTALFVVPLLAMGGAQATAPSVSIPLILTARIGAGFSQLANVFMLLGGFFAPVVAQLVAARMLWAQVRDGAWPGGDALAGLDRRGAPVRATLLCGLVAAILCLGWPVWYGFGTAVGSLWALGYGITIVADLAARAKGRLNLLRGRSLTRLSAANDVLAACWCAFQVMLLPLFDALHAIPRLALIVLIGLLAPVAGVRPKWANRRDVEHG